MKCWVLLQAFTTYVARKKEFVFAGLHSKSNLGELSKRRKSIAEAIEKFKPQIGRAKMDSPLAAVILSGKTAGIAIMSLIFVALLLGCLFTGIAHKAVELNSVIQQFMLRHKPS